MPCEFAQAADTWEYIQGWRGAKCDHGVERFLDKNVFTAVAEGRY